jgi:uncharacterized protein
VVDRYKKYPVLKEILSEIIKHAPLDRVILYGSGVDLKNQNPNDYDLLIIQETNLPRLRRRGALLKNIHYHVPLDLLILTPLELSQLIGARSSFIDEIIKNGIVLYEK